MPTPEIRFTEIRLTLLYHTSVETAAYFLRKVLRTVATVTTDNINFIHFQHSSRLCSEYVWQVTSVTSGTMIQYLWQQIRVVMIKFLTLSFSSINLA